MRPITFVKLLLVVGLALPGSLQAQDRIGYTAGKKIQDSAILSEESPLWRYKDAAGNFSNSYTPLTGSIPNYGGLRRVNLVDVGVNGSSPHPRVMLEKYRAAGDKAVKASGVLSRLSQADAVGTMLYRASKGNRQLAAAAGLNFIGGNLSAFGGASLVTGGATLLGIGAASIPASVLFVGALSGTLAYQYLVKDHVDNSAASAELAMARTILAEARDQLSRRQWQNADNSALKVQTYLQQLRVNNRGLASTGAAAELQQDVLRIRGQAGQGAIEEVRAAIAAAADASKRGQIAAAAQPLSRAQLLRGLVSAAGRDDLVQELDRWQKALRESQATAQSRPPAQPPAAPQPERKTHLTGETRWISGEQDRAATLTMNIDLMAGTFRSECKNGQPWGAALRNGSSYRFWGDFRGKFTGNPQVGHLEGNGTLTVQFKGGKANPAAYHLKADLRGGVVTGTISRTAGNQVISYPFSIPVN